MILKVFSIHDGKINAFLKPFVDQHTGSALRGFEEACREPSSPFAKFPSDFVLYEVGTFNPETGELVNYSPKIQLATPRQFIKTPLTATPLTSAPQQAEVSSANA